jgi:glycosyltransferase involved in cell wall biosynthesis
LYFYVFFFFMRILIAHNAYQQSGGEDAVVDAEIALLRGYGHEVEVYRRHNDELKSMSKIGAAASAIWSMQSANELQKLCKVFKPDLLHAHNTFPLIAPSLNWMAARGNIPVVQTLHNFRLLCPQATFMRHGQVCEDCLGKLPWRAVTRKCYRDSSLQSAVTVGMLVAHRSIGTYRNRITQYIALNDFCRNKFIEGGLPADKIRIKPNFVVSRDTPSWTNRKGGLFVGRLSPEKGLDVLITAVEKLTGSSIQMVGGGPLENQVRKAFQNNYLGFRSHAQVLALLHNAQFLVAPSTCYETFGLAIIEAFACGTPAIASRRGAFAELVKDGVTGLLFNPGDANDLAEKIAWAESNPEKMLRMGQAARAEYEAKYTPQRNYKMLIGIYEDAIKTAHRECQIA